MQFIVFCCFWPNWVELKAIVHPKINLFIGVNMYKTIVILCNYLDIILSKHTWNNQKNICENKKGKQPRYASLLSVLLRRDEVQAYKTSKTNHSDPSQLHRCLWAFQWNRFVSVQSWNKNLTGFLGLIWDCINPRCLYLHLYNINDS